MSAVQPGDTYNLAQKGGPQYISNLTGYQYSAKSTTYAQSTDWIHEHGNEGSVMESVH